MRIGFITDTGFQDIFRHIQHQYKVFVFNSLDEVKSEVDFLVVDNKYISANLFINFIEKKKDITKYFYILSEEDTSMTITLLQSKGIVTIPPKLTEKQMVDMIHQNVQGEKHSENDNIIVFLGADGKVGTSMVAQCVAEKLATNSSMKVLHVVLDGRPGLDYVHDHKSLVGIDAIKGKVVHHILSEEELISICIKINQLYLLKGTQSIMTRNLYHPEHIQTLLKLASKTFDIVIIDAGSNVELGITIGALNSTQHKCLITTQQATCINHFKLSRDQILSKLNIKNFMLIVNKYMDNNELLDKRELSHFFDAPIITTIPYSEYGWQAETEQCSLLNYNEANFFNAIKEISSFIEETLKINGDTKKEVPPSFWRKILKRRSESS